MFMLRKIIQNDISDNELNININILFLTYNVS